MDAFSKTADRLLNMMAVIWLSAAAVCLIQAHVAADDGWVAVQRLQEIEGQLKEAEESKVEAERRRRQVDDSRRAITEAGVKYQRACAPAVPAHAMLATSAVSVSRRAPVQRRDRQLVVCTCSSSKGRASLRAADVAMLRGAR